MNTDAPNTAAPNGITEAPVVRMGAGWLGQITEAIRALQARFGMIAEPSKEREPGPENQSTTQKAPNAPCARTPRQATQSPQRRSARLVESAQNCQIARETEFRVEVEDEYQDITTATTASTQIEDQVPDPSVAHPTPPKYMSVAVDATSPPIASTIPSPNTSLSRKMRHITRLEAKWGAGWEKTIDSHSDPLSRLSEHYLGGMAKLASNGVTLLDAKLLLRHVVRRRISRPGKGVRARGIVMVSDIQKVLSAIAAVSGPHNAQPGSYTTEQIIAFLGATERVSQHMTLSIQQDAPPLPQAVPSQRPTPPTPDMRETEELVAASPVAEETVPGGRTAAEAATQVRPPALGPRAGAGVSKRTVTRVASAQIAAKAKARGVEDKNTTTTTTAATQTGTRAPAPRSVRNTSPEHLKIETNSTPSPIKCIGSATTDKATKAPRTNTPREKPQGPRSQSMRIAKSALDKLAVDEIVPTLVAKEREEEQASTGVLEGVVVETKVKVEVKKEEEKEAAKAESLILGPRPGSGVSKRRSGSGGRGPRTRRRTRR